MVRRALRDADVLLAPYTNCVEATGVQDTSEYCVPLKILDYMSCGLPIICSDLPAIREVLPEDAAMYVPAESRDAWEQSVLTLARDRALRRVLGQRTSTAVTALDTWTDRARRFLTLVESGQWDRQ
jgi:glycosyltransferase involved in cell wall biosynthesis